MNQLQTQQPNPNVIWIIWAALAMSVLVYAGVGVVLRMTGNMPPMDPETAKLLTLVFAGVALMETVLAVAVLGKILARSGNFLTYCIVRWALMESTAIFGLVLMIMGVDLEIAGAFIVWGLLWILILAPTSRSKEKFEELSQMG